MLNVIPRRIQELHLRGLRSSLNEGVVLYADVSGFTSITESLLEHGKRGAESLSQLLNRIFSRAIDDIYGFEGEIPDFEGDGIIGVFPSDRPHLAYHAASSIFEYFRRTPAWRTELGEFPLSLRISLASGNLEWRIVGRDRLAFFVAGNAISRAAKLPAGRSKDPIIFHDSYIQLLRKSTKAGLDDLMTSKRPQRSSTGRSRIRKSTALRFVSESIVDSRMTGEFRTVTPVFVHMLNDDFVHLRERAEKLLEYALLYGGEPSGLYASKESCLNALVLFGAPVSWENNAERAFDFSLKLIDALGDSVRAGISSGTSYAGIIGNSRRCKYSVYGDTVNTASRLASKAKYGEILVTESACSGRYRKHSVSGSRRWLPRGKSDDILIHRLDNSVESSGFGSFSGIMLGRDRELTWLHERLVAIGDSRFGGVTVVFGEPGMGKSRLIFEAAHSLPFPCQCFTLKCDDILRKSLNPFVYFLRGLFSQNEARTQQQNRHMFEERMRFLSSELDEVSLPDGSSLKVEFERASSILGALLGHHWPDSVFSRLNPESLMDNTVLALKTLIKVLAGISPTVLLVEDMQWMDRDSRNALKVIIANSETVPCAVLVSSRFTDDGSTFPIPVDDKYVSRLELRGIDEKNILGVVKDRLGAAPGEKLSRFIIENSSGNPFYIEQFCMYLLESGQIQLESGTYRLSGKDVDIPSGIRSILVARMDRLPNRIRKFMQTASVLGQEFSADTLRLISGGNEEQDLIDEGRRLQLWSRQTGSTFAFNHALYRDTAYGMLLGKSLKKLHARAAEVLIELHRNDQEPVAAEIALHLKESQQVARAVDWGWRALCHAMDRYRNSEVLQWSDRLIDWITGRSTPGNTDELLLDVLMKRDSVLQSLGRRSEQKENLDLVMRLMKRENWEHRTAEILKARGSYAWSIGEAEEAYRLYSRGLEFTRRASDEAIRGKLLGNIANIHASRGRFGEAMDYYERALSIHRGLGDRKQEGITLGNLAILLRRTGEEDEARKCYEKALSIHRSSGNRIGEGRTLCGLGNLEKEPADALKYYMEALSINREIGDRRNEAIILSNLGRLETLEGNCKSAARYLKDALDIHRQIGNPIGEADTYCLFGEMHYSTKNWKEARESFGRAIEISRMTGNSRQECIYQGLMGLTCFDSGSLNEAAACYGRCFELVTEFRFPESIDDSVQMLRDRLLDHGFPEKEVPFPEHWIEQDISTF